MSAFMFVFCFLVIALVYNSRCSERMCTDAKKKYDFTFVYVIEIDILYFMKLVLYKISMLRSFTKFMIVSILETNKSYEITCVSNNIPYG